MSDAIRRAVDAALPGKVVESVDPQTVRPGNETARVAFADADPVYVKTATDTTRRLAREVTALRYAAAHCDVRTPGVVAADVAGDPPYLVTEPLPGTPLNDPWTDGADRGPLLREVGAAVAGVHAAAVDRPGVIRGGDADGLDLVGDSWTDVLCRTVEERAADWFPDRFADLPPALVETIRAVDPEVRGPPTLVHGDASRINIHLEPLGLLDWERALAGDPAFGLVDATFHHLNQPDVGDEDRPALREALEDGYRERAGDLPAGLEEHRALYRAVSYLLYPQAFERWVQEAPKSEDEHAADVREEFEARLERALAAAD